MSKPTWPCESLQQQVQELFVDVLAGVDLWGEQDRPGVGHGQIFTADGEGQQLLWDLRHLVPFIYNDVEWLSVQVASQYSFLNYQSSNKWILNASWQLFDEENNETLNNSNIKFL